MMWTSEEEAFLRSLRSPEKIQCYLNSLIYNSDDSCASPRYVMLTGLGHCFEGGLLAAAALELQGHRPLMVNLMGWNDDHHVLTIYKLKTGWGSVSKSNTTLLRGRSPAYRTVRELVMSYFDFYFNTKGQPALYAYTDPINLNHYNDRNWRTSDEDLTDIGLSFCERTHYELMDFESFRKLPKVDERIKEACFLGADPEGLFKA